MAYLLSENGHWKAWDGSYIAFKAASLLSFSPLLFTRAWLSFKSVKMQLTAATFLSSVLFGVSQASLYGESNLNHTCQLRMLLKFRCIHPILTCLLRNSLPLLLCQRLPEHNRLMLHRNVRRFGIEHPILGYIHRPRISRPSPPKEYMDSARPLA